MNLLLDLQALLWCRKLYARLERKRCLPMPNIQKESKP